MRATIGMIRASCLAILAGVLAAGCASRGPTVDRLGPDELFERGMASFEAKRWTDAIRAFDRLILESPSHPRIQEARFRLAEAYFMRKEYLTAASGARGGAPRTRPRAGRPLRAAPGGPPGIAAARTVRAEPGPISPVARPPSIGTLPQATRASGPLSPTTRPSRALPSNFCAAL